MNIITVNHTDLNGVCCALDVVMADEAIAIEQENKALFENNKELYAAGFAMRVENKRLRAALKVIADYDYGCECGGPSIARKTLEETK